MSDFYRKVWALGRAGVKVPLSVLQGAEIRNITIHSGDRYRYLRLRPMRKADYPSEVGPSAHLEISRIIFQKEFRLLLQNILRQRKVLDTLPEDIYTVCPIIEGIEN